MVALKSIEQEAGASMKKPKRKLEMEIIEKSFDMGVNDALCFIDEYNLSFEEVGRIGDFISLSGEVDPMLFYRINGVIKYPK